MNSTRTQQHTSQDNTPRIYVACLAAYNNGRLHGRWMDANQDVEALNDEVQAMLAESPEPGAEEFAVHDYEGFGGLELGEYESLETISRMAALVVEHGPLFAEVHGYAGNVEDAQRMLEEQHQGSWGSLAEWAENFMEDSGQLQGLPENLRGYFDFGAFGRDAELGGDIVTFAVDGDIHVFWTR